MFAGLPRKVNGHLENIHFLCASNKVPALKMAEPIVQQLLTLEERGMFTYDAHLKEKVLVVAPVITLICDNPRASELINHLGATARCYCRMCLVRCYHNYDIVFYGEMTLALEAVVCYGSQLLFINLSLNMPTSCTV